MIAQHLPVLLVVIPLLAAPICVLLGRGRAAWLVAVAVGWISFAIAIALLLKVFAEGEISYLLGSWAAPWGIEYRIDMLNAFVALIVTGIGAVVLPFAHLSIEAEIEAEKHHLFYCMLMLCLAGLLGITVTSR